MKVKKPRGKRMLNVVGLFGSGQEGTLVVIQRQWSEWALPSVLPPSPACPVEPVFSTSGLVGQGQSSGRKQRQAVRQMGRKDPHRLALRCHQKEALALPSRRNMTEDPSDNLLELLTYKDHPSPAWVLTRRKRTTYPYSLPRGAGGIKELAFIE